jgi:hypothetical protein
MVRGATPSWQASRRADLAAIAEQQKFSALLKMLRAGLT